MWGASEFIVAVVLAAAVCWITYVIVGFFRRRDQLRAASEFQLKLLERAESAREFAEVLNSEAGLLLMRSLATEHAARPQFRIVRSVQAALVLIGVGLALFIYIGETLQPDPVLAREAAASYATVSVFGTMAFGAGVALMIAAWIATRLSKKLGVVDELGDSSASSPRTSL